MLHNLIANTPSGIYDSPTFTCNKTCIKQNCVLFLIRERYFMNYLCRRFLLNSKIYVYWFTVQLYDFQFLFQMLYFLFRLRSHRMSFSLILDFKKFYFDYWMALLADRKWINKILILKTSLMEDLTWTSFEFRKFLFPLFLEHRR